ncbi:MAG: DNA polymerase I, partial [Gammaproteobacteria bacterium]|nr:DNA polymerase I [Gammaproteobacteria bacterium]
GDTSDNIPGVPKCGPKTAAKWLGQYGDLENLMANADEIKGKVGEYLRDSLEQLPLARELTTIKLDVELGQEVPELKPGQMDVEALQHHYTRLESKRLLDTLGDAVEPEPELENPEPVVGEYQTILDQEAFEAWVQRLEQSELFAFDTETNSLDYMQAELVGLSFAIEAGEAAYVPVAHNYPGAPQQLDRDQVLGRLKPLLEDAARAKVGQNLKYDMSVLARYGIEMRGIRFDTMLESYVFNSTGSRHDMDSLSNNYLGHATIKYEEVAGKGAKQITFDQVPLEQAAPYAAEDADITLRLHQRLWPALEQEPSLAGLLRDLEMPLVPVLSRMERSGVLVDSGMLKQQSQRFAEKLHDLEQRAYAIAGRPFNLGSPKQIGAIFFDELEMPVISKTPKGAPSTAESV